MHWRPKRIVNRQSANATLARKQARVPFLLHCDADEFLLPACDVPEQLTAMPEGRKCMKVPNFERALMTGAPHHPTDTIALAHFDSLTPLHWAAKFVRQAAFSPDTLHMLAAGRIAQWRQVFACLDDPTALRGLYDGLNGDAPKQIDELERDGHMIRAPFDLSEALQAVFPGQSIGISPEAFDEVLHRRVYFWRKKARRKEKAI